MRKTIVVLGLTGLIAAGAGVLGAARDQQDLEILRGQDAPAASRPVRQARRLRSAASEQITHITLWTIQAAPLLIGADMAQFDKFTTDLLTNHEVLEVNQDVLGRGGSRVRPRHVFQSVHGDRSCPWRGARQGRKAVVQMSWHALQIIAAFRPAP